MEVLDVRPVLPWEPIQIMPVGDFQYGAPGCDVGRLSRHIRWAASHGVFLLGMGDYSDILSPSNRKRQAQAALYDNAQVFWDQAHRRHMDELKEILAPSRGMWLGLHHGHHWMPYLDGSTSDTELADFLGCPYLGTAATTRLQFRGGTGHAIDCLTYSIHGEGSANDPFVKLRKVVAGFPQIDIAIQGHSTKLATEDTDNIWFYGSHGHLRMRDKTQKLVVSGGFMRGYQQGSRMGNLPQGSYVEQGMMRPSTLGGPLITITPRHREHYNELDIKCSV